MTDGPPGDFSRLGDLLAGVGELPTSAAPTDGSGAGAEAGGAGRSPRDIKQLLATAWPDVVGSDVAANARPVQLRQGRLMVSASSSAWAQTLQLMSEAIVGRLNERLGRGTVERVVFRHAGWEDRPQRPVAGEPAAATGAPAADPAPKLSSEQQQALAAVERLDLAPELREKIVRAMKAAFVRGEQDSVR